MVKIINVVSLYYKPKIRSFGLSNIKKTLLVRPHEQMPLDFSLSVEPCWPLRESQVVTSCHITKKFKNVTLQFQLYKKTFGGVEQSAAIGLSPIQNLRSKMSLPVYSDRHLSVYGNSDQICLTSTVFEKSFFQMEDKPQKLKYSEAIPSTNITQLYKKQAMGISFTEILIILVFFFINLWYMIFKK